MQLTFISILVIILNSSMVLCEPFDAKVLRNLHTERNVKLDDFMKWSSNSTFILLPAVPLGLFTSSRITNDTVQCWNSIEIASSVVLSGATSFLLKHIFVRERPFEKYDFIENIGNENGYSFPSSHAATSFAMATSVSLAYPKWYIIVPSYIWASLVAWSRMHLGVHYLTDVVAGALVGIGVSFATNKIFTLIR